MMVTHGIAFKALTRLLQNLRGEREIVLGAGNVHVTKVRGQLREQTLYIGAALVPELHSMRGRGMPQVMESGLIAGAIVAQHVSVYPQPAERVLGRGARETMACAPHE